MGNLLAQAQQMQKALDQAREELRQAEVDGTAGGGVVRAVVTGEGQLIRVEITEEAHRASDRGMLEQLVTGAVRDAQERAQREASERLSQVTGGLQLPGFF